MKVILIGGSSHALCLADLLTRHPDYQVMGYVNPEKSELLEFPHLGSDDDFLKTQIALKKDVRVLMGIGGAMKVREKLFLRYKEAGFQFLTLVDPSAVISSSAELGEGTVVFPGAVIGARAQLSENVLIHSNAVVEHETTIGAHSYLSPGAIVSGSCRIGARTMLGSNSTLIDGIELGARNILGAGAVLTKSFLSEDKVLVGIPAKEKNSK